MSPPIKKMDTKKYQIDGLGLQNIKPDIVTLHRIEDSQKCLTVCKSIVREHSVGLIVEESTGQHSTSAEEKKVSKVKTMFANFIFSL
jgi:hypothetical protein